ncbi:hypothetical protein RHMOL_Rhmol11G0078800 [Rhododendron molle]|uniref:Uncharacterized protein n=1 Tax=Rhododendron molle TaxID=49168 RepID=A0ACC0LPX8_RHOML|nr:hypothetical protein RHMOL_Rhmol11G0078800 [Rhododendron molle]
MHNLFETNKLLELKVAKLQVELDKANATFKKLNAGSQVVDGILSSQKVSSDKGGLGANKAKSPIKENNVKHAHTKTPKAKMRRATVPKTTIKHGEVNAFKFKPFCHHCGLQGHIRPHCTKLHVTHNSYAYLGHSYRYVKDIPTCHNCRVIGHIRPHCKKLYLPNKIKNFKDAHFIPTCHFCGMKDHIRPNCFKLRGYHRTPPHYHNMNNQREYFQRFRRRTPSHSSFTKVNSKPMTNKRTHIRKAKTRQIWVRKINLVSNVGDDLNSLDDYSSSEGVDLAF